MKPELSNRNPYKIGKHRYYELLHFCRQYNDYQKEKKNLYDTYVKPVLTDADRVMTTPYEDRTENFAIKLANIDDKIKLIETCAIESDPGLSGYIMIAVTSGITYETLLTRYKIPCSRDVFYDRYRKFFYILDQKRN